MSQTPQTWDLEVIFDGGSSSAAFHQFLESLRTDIASFAERVEGTEVGASAERFAHLIEVSQNLATRLRQCGAFVGCLTAQDTKDEGAKLLQGKVSQTSAQLTSTLTSLDAKLIAMADSEWQAFLEQPSVAKVRFSVEERRRRAKEKLPPAQEKLISDLMVDGYHGWGQLYDEIAGRMSLTYEEADGKTTELSMGQAANKLVEADRTVREQVFAKWEDAWSDSSDLCASALNRLGGYRLAVYRHRGWDNVLHEPLEINRMEARTLNTMWSVIEQNKAPFVAYLNRKAQLLGLEQLSWHDVSAPIGKTANKLSYDDARAFVVDNFGKFSPRMAEFANAAFDKRWVEAEDRPNKGAGAFCTSFPFSKETRVFMTFSGTPGNVSTLAHELGHAYHQHVMRDLPQFAQNYAMNVAETASTFAEAIVTDAAVRSAADKAQRIALLDDKIERSVAMFMNIHARFLFETQFYAERRQGMVGVDRLNEIMVEAQKAAYGNALSTWHPHFWASKLHFYITGVPFYNFPYTFGYLFSSGIYARALQEGPTFADKYVALLRDTASMRVEDLAHKHLGVDLTQPGFWQDAINVSVADASEFLDLTK